MGSSGGWGAGAPRGRFFQPLLPGEQQPPAELVIRVIVPEPDSYVSGVTMLKAEILPKMLRIALVRGMAFSRLHHSPQPGRPL